MSAPLRVPGILAEFSGTFTNPPLQHSTRSYSDRQRTASFLKASLPTDCVLLVSQLVNELRSSCAQTSCKECASLRQAVRSALRSAGRKGSTLKCEPATTLRVYCFAVSRLER